jgi:flagellin
MSAVGSILTNSGALQALNSISNTSAANNSLESQLSSGLSINSPSDNPAGYITAQGFTSQLNGLTQAISNANQGVSLLQTAQGAITQQIGVTQQLNSIAVQAANGTQTSAESQSLQTLTSQLTSQVSTIAKQTQFNNISLLDGSFQGVQFQVGANEGQTMSLSIANTNSSAIGMWHSSASATAYTGTNGSAKDGKVGSGAITLGVPASTVGAFTAGSAVITGANGQTQTVKSTAGESAASLASAVNSLSSQGGVQAQASTQATFKLTQGTNGQYQFGIQAASSGATTIGTKQSIVASSAAGVVSEINSQSSTSGITASLDKNNNLVLSQSAGENINITGASSGSLTAVNSKGVALSGAQVIKTGAASAVIQGQVQLQSSAAFSVTGGTAIGVGTSSKLADLGDINVSNTSGANAAINVVKYALASLNNQGGTLGAVQQSMSANINNMNTTSQNLTTALGVVQDANIPAVSNKLTQSQIQAQAGVAALKSSTQLQQSYLSLLP